MAKRSIELIDDELVDCCSPLASDVLSEREARDVAAIFAALGDPVRLRLLSIIASTEECCSCNLEEPLGKSQPTISHHTRILAEAGLIVAESEAVGRGGAWSRNEWDVAARLLMTRA